MPHKLYKSFTTTNEMQIYFLDKFNLHLESKDKNKLSPKMFFRREIDNVEKEMQRRAIEPQIKSKLNEFCYFLQDYADKYKAPKRAIIEEIEKLKWNGDKHLLTNLFFELRKINTKEGKSIIPHTVEELAHFLKNNFETFDDTSESTIRTQLTKESKQPKKARFSIVLKHN